MPALVPPARLLPHELLARPRFLRTGDEDDFPGASKKGDEGGEGDRVNIWLFRKIRG